MFSLLNPPSPSTNSAKSPTLQNSAQFLHARPSFTPLAAMADDKPGETINSLRIISGGLAAASAKTILAPLNRLTILLQSQGMSSLQHNYTTTPAYTGIFSSLQKILKNEGFTSLWNGNGVNVLRVLPNYGLRFALNDASREWVCKINGMDPRTTRHSMTKTQLFSSSAIAAVIQIVLTYPIEVISTRLTVSGSELFPVKYKGALDCLSQTIKHEGVSSLYNGCKVTVLAGTPYISIQMSLFELFQRQLHTLFDSDAKIDSNTATNAQHTQDSHNAQANNTNFASDQDQNRNQNKLTQSLSNTSAIGVLPKLIAGASASLIAQTFTYPGDILRRRMQVDGMGSDRNYAYSGICHAIKTIYHQEGWKAFFKGIHVNSLRILPEGALLFILVDFFKKVVDIEKYDAH